MNTLDRLLSMYRSADVASRERGTYFERLACAYLKSDPVQAEEFEDVWSWADWARATGRDTRDTGIDLVAKLRNEDGYAAIQVKFYAADARIRKEDIDSFISASGKEPFKRRVVIDTTEREWSSHADPSARPPLSPAPPAELAPHCGLSPPDTRRLAEN